MGRRSADHARRAFAQYSGARILPQPGRDVLMSEIMNAAVLQPAEQTMVQKIQVKKLNFFYGGFQALKDINLDIPERKVTAFIGPSGCGKSTLLRTFNRMYALYPKQEAPGDILLAAQHIPPPPHYLNR